jgi:AraC-like DNA-binding protein
VSQHLLPYFLNVWHYHVELELLFIQKSTGTLFIGDYVGEFSPGDIILIGSNLPHMMLNDKSYFSNSSKQTSARSIAIHFDPDFLGRDFFNTPEAVKVKEILTDAQLGIRFNSNKKQIASTIVRLDKEEGFSRILLMLELLNQLADCQQFDLLSSPGFVQSYGKKINTKLDKVYDYLFNNYLDDISLETTAAHVMMNSSAFSRFFKKTTNKSFVRYLIELRIGHACKMLLEDSYKNVSEICYESGFNNLSSFNKQFKIVTGKTPSDYVSFHHQPTMVVE